jgi:hypothetical protein
MQRFYEVMFIVRPDVADEDLDKLIAGLEQTSPSTPTAFWWRSWSAASASPSR